MSVPSDFAPWCAFHGYSLVPAEWDAAAHAEYRAWRLARFRAHLRHYRDCGQWALIRQQSGRAYLIQQIRAELDAALAPPPPEVYGRSEGRLPLRRDVGAKFSTMSPVMLGVLARI